MIAYDDLPALEKALEDPNVCAFLVEPIQGEKGVYVPADDYITGRSRRARPGTCSSSRTRSRPVSHAPDVCWPRATAMAVRVPWACASAANGVSRPDVVILAKALSGGMYPVSAVLANDAVMDVFTPGTHGSTYGGNPMGARVAMEALGIVKDEELAPTPNAWATIFRSEMQKLVEEYPYVKLVRGKGLLNARGHRIPHRCGWNAEDRVGAMPAAARQRPAGQADARRHHPLRTAAGDHRGAADGVLSHHRAQREAVRVTTSLAWCAAILRSVAVCCPWALWLGLAPWRFVGFPKVRPLITGGEDFRGPAGPRKSSAGPGLLSTSSSHENEYRKYPPDDTMIISHPRPRKALGYGPPVVIKP